VPDGSKNALAADWIGVCRRAAGRTEAMLAEHPSTAERQPGAERGAGGDRTLTIDNLAEDVVFAELETLHAAGCDFTAISEERGTVVFGTVRAKSASWSTRSTDR
jgi:myo-inositol-1(or 4)-monophosphatase